MSLIWSLIIWVIIFAVTYYISRKKNIRTSSALVLSALVSYSYIVWFVPPKSLGDTVSDGNFWSFLYLLILVGSPIVFFIYIIWKSLKDRSPETDLLKWDG